MMNVNYAVSKALALMVKLDCLDWNRLVCLTETVVDFEACRPNQG